METVLACPNTEQNAIKRSLKVVLFRKKVVALLLIAPLAIFLMAVFVLPVATLLKRSVENPEIVDALPQTSAVLSRWDRKSDVPVEAYGTLLRDLEKAGSNDAVGQAAGRLNRGKSGFRSLLLKTSSALPFTPNDLSLSSAEVRNRLIKIDRRWDDTSYWDEIAKNSSRYTPFYLLAAVDYTQDVNGRVVAVDSGASNYQAIFQRTFTICCIVTLATLLIGFPLAYWISTLPTSKANMVLILVLLPFWTSILVRISAWIVLLQGQGLVNKALMSIGVITEPLELLFNRTGVLISMTHILLPFMILPLYSVMKSIPPTYQKAAISLGSHPFGAFYKVYLPQTYPGVGAGALLVFIIALGYYITPALLGGPNDQMVSYYIAYFTNVMVNWGLACALGALLLVATLILFAIYRKVDKQEVSAG